jgi:hypothetical protein
MNAFKVLVIGVGQLGSRYIQGLARCSSSLHICAVDPSPASLAIAQERWLDSVPTDCSKTIVFCDSLRDCSESYDLAIVSTTATKRHEIIRLVSEVSEVRFWILEKVLAQSPTEVDLILDALGSLGNAWVNTPRRSLKWHGEIRNLLSTPGPLKMEVKGNNWGLACNSIHFLDMLSWMAGEALTGISTKELCRNWIKAKRAGYWEVEGSISATYSNGTTAKLVDSHVTSTHSSYNIKIQDSKYEWWICEEMGSARRSDGMILPGCLPLQSEETPRLVDQILLTGHCELTPVGLSAQMHRIFLRSMLEHWRETVNPAAINVPIT